MVKDIVKANETVKPNDREMAVLRAHFADCFQTDGAFDLARFQARLGDRLSISNEGYGLNFLGKNYARLLTVVDTTTVVVPDGEHNARPENAQSQNVYISGDNLDALKQLLKSYARQVKCIYIDPPYNTGSDGFVYNDRFNFTAEEIAARLNLSDEQAERILQFARRGSASHSAWLMFMYPRLQLARDLLSDDGVIFISIDDNEQANLKLLCDEVFGESCFLGNFLWKKRQNVDSRTKNGVSSDHDYLLCYGRRETSRIQGKETDKAKYSNPDHDLRGDWMSADMTGLATAEQRPNLHYVLKNPATGMEYACPDTGWRYEPSRMEELIAKGEVLFPDDPTRRPRRKKFLKDVESEYTGFSTVLQTAFSAQGTRELRELFDDVEVFDFPKPVDYIKLILAQGSADDSIVVDFFSGSATTAQAVMELNRDGGHRKYILVQIQEPCAAKSAAATAGYRTIDEIGRARIKRAAARIAAENPLLAKTMDLGFRHYTLKEPTGAQLETIEKFNPDEPILLASDDILKEFGLPTVLATWLVRDGYGLTAAPTKVELDGYVCWWMKDHLYFIEAGGQGLTEDGIVQLMEKYETDGSFNPSHVVIFGYGGLTWTMRENLERNLQKLRPDNNATGAKKLAITFDVRY